MMLAHHGALDKLKLFHLEDGGFNHQRDSKLYLQAIELDKSSEILEKLVKISPMSWIHIAFTGRYNFKKGNKKIDLNEIISTLAEELKARKRKG